MNKYLYNTHDPLPVSVEDLADLADSKPRGKVVKKLKWTQLTSEFFERLIFSMISQEESTYENVGWLMHTNAPDQGQDISATRINKDSLANVRYQRVIIQCRHWLRNSIGINNISTLRDQMRLWSNPAPVDTLIIVTSGRFTADAVKWVEEHNSRERLQIEMWPESHLERLLASRSHLIAEFGLR